MPLVGLKLSSLHPLKRTEKDTVETTFMMDVTQW
jgi:hypothetical protein